MAPVAFFDVSPIYGMILIKNISRPKGLEYQFSKIIQTPLHWVLFLHFASLRSTANGNQLLFPPLSLWIQPQSCFEQILNPRFQTFDHHFYLYIVFNLIVISFPSFWSSIFSLIMIPFLFGVGFSCNSRVVYFYAKSLELIITTKHSNYHNKSYIY